MNSISKALAAYQIGSPYKLDTDGRIGIPVEITLFFDQANHTVVTGHNGTPLIVYVVNAQTERVGTAKDEDIIRSMLERGYIVAVLDYLNSEKAVGSELDWSAQALRARVTEGEFLPKDVFPEGTYIESFVVPSGYDVSPNHVFWSIDRHGADGTFDKIIEIWNNDFRGHFCDLVIPWTREDGSRKPVQTAHDGSEPVWLNANGEECPDGTHIRIKHTKAVHITDCVKKDGSPIAMDLSMHLIYPVAPEKPVPVMCLANSAGHMTSCAANKERPQLNGFLFRGYAGVIYDYCYTPMARDDHYGYFDGNNSTGRITGDNVTYSIQFFNDKKYNTAAMRYIRYLALSDPRFRFKLDAIGAYGNSKGGHMVYLGGKHPEKLQEVRYCPGHHGETRYENGITQDEGIIRGGEEQPWLTWEGKPIDSSVAFLYCGCGGSNDSIDPGHAPHYIPCMIRDGLGSFHNTANKFRNLYRIYDLPALCLDIDLGHTLAYGPDVEFGVDSYSVLYDLTGYYLKSEPVKVVYTVPATGAKDVSAFAPVTIKFTGPVPEEEIRRVSVCADGRPAMGAWSSLYGKTEWVFTPSSAMENGAEYTVSVPAGLKGCNGMPMACGYIASFRTTDGQTVPLGGHAEITHEQATSLRFAVPAAADRRVLLRAFIENDAANAIQVYSAETGAPVGEIRLRGAGAYELDVTDYLAALPAGSEAALTLKAAKPSGTACIFHQPLSDSLGGGRISPWIRYEFAPAPDGTPSLKFSEIGLNKSFVNDDFYTNTELYENDAFAYESAPFIDMLTEKDYGRKLNICLSIYDVISRRIRTELNSCCSSVYKTSDRDRNIYNEITRAGEWTTVEIDYAVYDAKYGEAGRHPKTFILKCPSTGNLERPMYLKDLTVTETITDIQLGEASLLIR